MYVTIFGLLNITLLEKDVNLYFVLFFLSFHAQYLGLDPLHLGDHLATWDRCRLERIR